MVVVAHKVGGKRMEHDEITIVAQSLPTSNDGSIIRSWQALSDNGDFVVFHSLASNLVSNDHHRCASDPFPAGKSCSDVFVHRTSTRETTLVSQATDGDSGN